ncbi:50S ribosomal protein L18 [Blattabacterium sp. (Cryptocercus punctulatus) str. Cpu]|uniref:50S ribosomal protein L18 n=1 Tax=Blattabacterium sp. (Cryptocercus punctulatus) str. Cpu TaxID=1075399 RepID=UPI00023872D7|nr:50S ribosomal protein L18 [Blattabacterium sp. (Cryptocercus punctulatus) str. Cpu]AEU09298.1 50S ribosomal protein L18 [Blattabacterium sp. (Cryptocercus punctulatus) str. Cpu]
MKGNKKKFKKFLGTKKKPRITVFRSNKAIYAQIIDDLSGKTLVSSSSREKIFRNNMKIKQTKIKLSNEVGKLLGERASLLKIKKVIFDRGKYLYHGRIKSLAEGVREMGLDF